MTTLAVIFADYSQCRQILQNHLLEKNSLWKLVFFWEIF